MHGACKDYTNVWVHPEPQIETQGEGWEFFVHLCYQRGRILQVNTLYLLLFKCFQFPNYPCTRTRARMFISNVDSSTTHEPSLHSDTTVILRSQSKRCGEAFPRGLNDGIQESTCLGLQVALWQPWVPDSKWQTSPCVFNKTFLSLCILVIFGAAWAS